MMLIDYVSILARLVREGRKAIPVIETKTDKILCISYNIYVNQLTGVYQIKNGVSGILIFVNCQANILLRCLRKVSISEHATEVRRSGCQDASMSGKPVFVNANDHVAQIGIRSLFSHATRYYDTSRLYPAPRETPCLTTPFDRTPATQGLVALYASTVQCNVILMTL